LPIIEVTTPKLVAMGKKLEALSTGRSSLDAPDRRPCGCAALIDSQCSMGAGVEKCEHCDRQIRANCVGFHAFAAPEEHVARDAAVWDPRSSLLGRRDPSRSTASAASRRQEVARATRHSAGVRSGTAWIASRTSWHPSPSGSRPLSGWPAP